MPSRRSSIPQVCRDSPTYLLNEEGWDDVPELAVYAVAKGTAKNANSLINRNLS
jgi:hypothetical protein